MKAASSLLAAFGVLALGLAGAACAGAPAGAGDGSRSIVVPPQPPQPVLAPPPATPTASPVASHVAASPFRCDGGKRFEVGARSYCGYEEPDTWEGAERRCVASGGHLMTLDTEATSAALHQALGSPLGAGRAAWIGLELKVKGKPGPNEWKWSSGEPVKAASWNTGEPNDFDHLESCGEWLVASGRWNDTRCEMRQRYLCESLAGKELRCKAGRAFIVGGITYCLNAAERSFTEAKRACAADGGQLAELKSSDANRAVRDAMAARFSAAKMWIGLTDTPEEGSWSWVSGAPTSHEAWAPGEPNDFGGEDCAQLFSDTWTWNDLDCSARLPSVCESSKR
jgi:mannose receptor, C type